MNSRTGALAHAWNRSARWLALVTLAVAGGCDDGAPAVADHPPVAPAADDPAFELERVPGWMLVGNPLTAGHDELALEVTAPAGVDHVDAFIGDLPGVRLERADNVFRATLEVSSLGPGEHELLLSADSSETGFARRLVRRSHPLYVVVSTDWDDADNTQVSLDLQAELHATHPELRLTHFVGPYTYTDPTLTEERRAELSAWLAGMRDDFGDEIGLHIHPYCNFVVAAGMSCRTQPSVVYAAGDVTGYTVMLNSYDEDELVTLFEKSDDLFMENGLGKPTSFRAGAWIADLKVLRALAQAGYLADTSANNWSRMEEWQGVENGVIYDWNMINWAPIGDTSQPYYPSQDDVLVPGTPAVPVLEVPDNGILVDYVTREEMIGIFDANFAGSPLDAPRAYSIGYHPSNFTSLFKDRIHFTLVHAEQFLASAGRGPVVYARLSDLVKVWPAP